MIVRIWHGWTSAENADAYERLLNEVVVPGILVRGLPGVRHVDILRRRDAPDSGQIEFVTIMAFDEWASVESFAGPGGTNSVVPEQARRLLKRFDDHSQHYDLIGHHDADS